MVSSSALLVPSSSPAAAASVAYHPVHQQLVMSSASQQHWHDTHLVAAAGSSFPPTHDMTRQGNRSANQKKSFPSKYNQGRRSALIPSLSVCTQHILILKRLFSVQEKLNEVDCPELLQLIRYDNEIPLLIIRRMDSSSTKKRRRRFVLELTWTYENIFIRAQ